LLPFFLRFCLSSHPASLVLTILFNPFSSSFLIFPHKQLSYRIPSPLLLQPASQPASNIQPAIQPAGQPAIQPAILPASQPTSQPASK
jgi:hypothetical protein